MRKEKFEIEGLPVDQVLEGLEAGFSGAEIDRTDGLKLILDEGWVHVRKSNTEPVLRLLAEGRSADAVDGIVGKARRLVSESTPA
jgi:phosphomannomutase